MPSRWRRLCPGISDELADAFHTCLAGMYTRTGHHTMVHIDECLALLDVHADQAEHRDAVELAIWFHDAIYQPGASDNEQKSAELAAVILPHLGRGELAESVRALILATMHDHDVAGADEQLMVDIDLSVLGSESARYARYVADIQAEFAWAAPAAFQEGRRALLAALLLRPAIFATSAFRDRFEARARLNLTQELSELSP